MTIPHASIMALTLKYKEFSDGLQGYKDVDLLHTEGLNIFKAILLGTSATE